MGNRANKGKWSWKHELEDSCNSVILCRNPKLCREQVCRRYRISSVIRRSFFFFQNNPKDLDLSCKTDLDLLDCLGRVNLVL